MKQRAVLALVAATAIVPFAACGDDDGGSASGDAAAALDRLCAAR